MRIYFASDHAGFELRQFLMDAVREDFWGTAEVIDCGNGVLDEADDYPDFILPMAQKVTSDAGSFGIAIGGSGQGEAMVSNRVQGARAVVFYGGERGDEIIKLSRGHNNANILSIGARFVSEREALHAVLLWLHTPFTGEERHVRRIAKLSMAANNNELECFDKWNNVKKQTEEISKLNVYFRSGDIFFARLGKNIGFEQDGKGADFLRPILIVRKFSPRLFWGIALTTKDKKHPFYYSIGNIRGQKNIAIVNQMRLFDAKRLDYKAGSISQKSLDQLRAYINDVMCSNIKPPHLATGGEPIPAS